MSRDLDVPSANQPLNDILAAYLQAVDAGHAPDRQRLLVSSARLKVQNASQRRRR